VLVLFRGKDIQFVLVPGRFPESKHLETYLNIYNCWKDVWGATFQELDGLTKIQSDAFTRQDFISAVMVDGECKAMCLYRYADNKNPTTEADSYFSNWSELHRKALTKRGSHVLVCSYFTVHPTARKETLGFSMRDLLIAQATQITMSTGMHVMTGAMRKNRGVHELAYEWGALEVGRDIASGHGDALVDLVAFYGPEVQKAHETQELAPIAAELWEQRLVVTQVPIETIEHFLPVAKPLVFKKVA
jgi:hypothetical protein